MISREMAERVLRRAIEDHARDADALSEQDIVEIAREVGVDPEHVWRALEHERRLEWVKDSVRLQQEEQRARQEVLSPSHWRVLIAASILFGGFGAGLATVFIEAGVPPRTPVEYLAVGLVVVVIGFCFLPLYELVSQIVRARRRRGR